MGLYAHIKEGVVANVIVADKALSEDHVWLLPESPVTIGWFFEDGEFIEPPHSPGHTPEEFTESTPALIDSNPEHPSHESEA